MSAARPGGHEPCYFPRCGRSWKHRAKMTFPGTLDTFPLGPVAGRKAVAKDNPASQLWVPLEWPSTTVNPLGAGSHGRAWGCRCLPVARLLGPQWLRNPVCPQTQCFHSSWRRRPACPPVPVPPPTREPPSCQRSGCGRGWGTCQGPRPAMPRAPRKAEMTHALEK